MDVFLSCSAYILVRFVRIARTADAVKGAIIANVIINLVRFSCFWALIDESNPIESVRSIITPIITVASTWMMSLSSSVNKTNEYYLSMIKIFPYHKQPTASNLSIDYLGKHVLWSQERKEKHYQTIICHTRHHYFNGNIRYIWNME